MPALVTPFDEDGEIDLDAHRHNLATLAGRGVAGFVIAGSTGEGPYLEPGERSALVGAAREELGTKPFLVCGVAAETLRAARRQTAEAADAGADAALVMTPTALVRGRHDAVRTFYIELAADAPLPVLLYSVPAVTGYELPVDVAQELLSHRTAIVGMKDSGGHPVRIQQLAGAVEGSFLFGGASRAVSLSVAGGGHGAITASGNYAPSLVREVITASRKGKAADAQERLTGLVGLVEARGLAGTKLAASVAGLRPGHSRRPVRPLGDADAAQLQRQLAVLRSQLLG